MPEVVKNGALIGWMKVVLIVIGFLVAGVAFVVGQTTAGTSERSALRISTLDNRKEIIENKRDVVENRIKVAESKERMNGLESRLDRMETTLTTILHEVQKK